MTGAARPLMLIAVAVVGIFERQQRLVADRLDETGAEGRNGNPARDHVRFRRQDRLTPCVGFENR